MMYRHHVGFVSSVPLFPEASVQGTKQRYLSYFKDILKITEIFTILVSYKISVRDSACVSASPSRA